MIGEIRRLSQKMFERTRQNALRNIAKRRGPVFFLRLINNVKRRLLILVVLGLAALVRIVLSMHLLFVSIDTLDFYAHVFHFLRAPLEIYRMTVDEMKVPWLGEIWQPVGVYAYPPIWILVLSCLSTAFAGPYLGPWARGWMFVYVERALLIVVDLIVGFMIYLRFGKNRKGVLGASLYLFSFMPILESALWGQFDAIPTMFLLASLLSIDRNKARYGGFFAGLALMTKQWALYAIVPIFFYLLRKSRKNAFDYALTVFEVSFVLSAPFMLDIQSAEVYLTRVWMYGSYPELFALNWESALSCWIHNQACGFYQVSLLAIDAMNLGFQTFLWIFWIGRVAQLFVMALVVMSALRWDIDANRAMMLGLLAFLSTSWILHPQYTISVIPFLMTDAMRSRKGFKWFLVTLLPSVVPLFGWSQIYGEIGLVDPNFAGYLRDVLESPVGFHAWTWKYFLMASACFLYVACLAMYLFQTLRKSSRMTWKGLRPRGIENPRVLTEKVS